MSIQPKREILTVTAHLAHALGEGLPDTSALEWMSRGSCVSSGHPDLWYADREHWQDTVAAKRICNTRCPVVARCLNHAIENDERWGTWGGTSEHERRKLRRKWRESAA